MADRVKPYSGLSVDRLTNLLNTESNTNYVYNSDFVFGNPTPATGPGGQNTIVSVIPTGQRAPSHHLYKRLNINILGDLRGTASVLAVDVGDGNFNIHDILPQINDKLGVDLTTAEVQNTQYSQLDTHYRLTITNSLAWLPGSFYDFRSTYQPE